MIHWTSFEVAAVGKELLTTTVFEYRLSSTAPTATLTGEECPSEQESGTVLYQVISTDIILKMVRKEECILEH
jgi:hypothetical protein